MDNSVAAYKDAYLQAAKENAAIMLGSVAVLRTNSSDTNALENLFIKSHSLKGQSMTMGFTGIAKAALIIERYTRLIRDGEKSMDVQVLSEVDQAIQEIQRSFETIEKHDKENPLAMTITKLTQVTGVSV